MELWFTGMASMPSSEIWEVGRDGAAGLATLPPIMPAAVLLVSALPPHPGARSPEGRSLAATLVGQPEATDEQRHSRQEDGPRHFRGPFRRLGGAPIRLVVDDAVALRRQAHVPRVGQALAHPHDHAGPRVLALSGLDEGHFCAVGRVNRLRRR